MGRTSPRRARRRPCRSDSRPSRPASKRAFSIGAPLRSIINRVSVLDGGNSASTRKSPRCAVTRRGSCALGFAVGIAPLSCARIAAIAARATASAEIFPVAAISSFQDKNARGGTIPRALDTEIERRIGARVSASVRRSRGPGGQAHLPQQGLVPRTVDELPRARCGAAAARGAERREDSDRRRGRGARKLRPPRLPPAGRPRPRRQI